MHSDHEMTGEELQRLVSAAAAKNAKRHPGVVVGAVDTIRSRRAVAGMGHTRLPDGPAPTDQTMWEIGSITKVFTGLLLAIAVVRGEVTLQTPVRELLPTGTVPTREGVEITLEHLTTHRSGLPRSPVGFPTEFRTILLGRGNPYADISDERLLEFVARTELSRTPGTGRMAYSNVGGGLLGLALTHRAGAGSYGELVHERICRPLGLARTMVLAQADIDQLAAGYATRRRPVEHWTLSGLAGAGALLSTATDMLTFLSAQLKPESSDLGQAIKLSQAERYGSGRFSIGLGWIRYPSRSGLTLWHNGGTGGFHSFAGIAVERGVGVVMLTNSRRSCDRAAMRLLSRLSAWMSR
jgi:serine-type D-Ala-D-Ala carboxypeptidase/endopeptidase